MLFPQRMGGPLAGKTFEEVWLKHCNFCEFATIWERESCTDVFLLFYDFIAEKMKDLGNVADHIARCVDYCKHTDEIPQYLTKYVDGN